MIYTKFKKNDSKLIYYFCNKQTNQTFLKKLHSIFLNKIFMGKFNKNVINLRKSFISKSTNKFFRQNNINRLFKKFKSQNKKYINMFSFKYHYLSWFFFLKSKLYQKIITYLYYYLKQSTQKIDKKVEYLFYALQKQKRENNLSLFKTNCYNYKSLIKKNNIQFKNISKSNFLGRSTLFLKNHFRLFLFDLTNLSKKGPSATFGVNQKWKPNLICLNYSLLYSRRLHNLDKNFWFQYYNIQSLFLKTCQSLNKTQYISQINNLLKNKLINFFILNDLFWKITDTIGFVLPICSELKNYEKNIKEPNLLRMKYLNTNYLINNNLIHNYSSFKKTYRNSRISYNKRQFLKTFIYLKIKKKRNLWFFQLLFFLINRNLLTVIEKFDFKQHIKKQIFNYYLTLYNYINQISSYLENKTTTEDFIFYTEFIQVSQTPYKQVGNSKISLMNHYFKNYECFVFMKNSVILFKKTLISLTKINQILNDKNLIPFYIFKNGTKVELFFYDIHLIFNLDLFQNINLFFEAQNDFINFDKISFILEYNSVLFFLKNLDLSDKQNLEINLNFKIKILTLLIEKSCIFNNFIFMFIFLILNLLFLDYFIKSQQQRFKAELKLEDFWNYLIVFQKNQFILFIYKNFFKIDFQSFLIQLLKKSNLLIENFSHSNSKKETFISNYQFYKNHQFQYMISNNFLSHYLIIIRTYLKQNKSQSQKKILENLIIIQKVFLTHFQSFLSTKQLSFCDKEVRKALWRWACRRHSNKSHEWIKNRYFQLFHFNNRFFRLFSLINKNSSFCYPCHYDYLKSKSFLNLFCIHFSSFNQKYKIEVFNFALIKIKMKKIKTKKNINFLILTIYTPCRT